MTILTSPGVQVTRTRVLDVAERMLWDDGLRALSPGRVAAAAGISRAWLYRLFPDKRALVLAALLRFDEVYWASSHRRVGAHRDLAHQVAEAVAMARELERGPLMIHLRTTEPETFAAVVGADVRAFEPAMVEFWTGYLRAGVAAGLLRADLDVDDAATWVLRIVISLVTVPLGDLDVDDVEAVATSLRQSLLCAVVAATGTDAADQEPR